MDIAFNAIGFEISNENAFHDLAEDVGRRGEASVLQREGGGILHGRCLKIGAGLEVWTLLYETLKGEVVYADCRPAFRARYVQKISPWILNETDNEAAIHGFLEDTETEVLFQLQNLTEVGSRVFEQTTLSVGLCGLAYRAEIFEKRIAAGWRSYDEIALNVIENENDWRIAGRILACEALRNPQSGSDLYWIHIASRGLQLEILVNQRALRGAAPVAGAFIEADIWLQGHIANEPERRRAYEGVDTSYSPADFWRNLRKLN